MRRNHWCFPAKELLKQFDDDTFASVIAAQLKLPRQTIQRWRGTDTMFHPYQADEYAIRIGKHPSEIWVDWFDMPELQPKPKKEKKKK